MVKSDRMSSKPRLSAYLALGCGISFLSLSSLFVRWATAPGVVTSFYRMALAALIIFPVALSQMKKHGAPSKKVILFPLLAGVFAALDHAVWSSSVQYTRVANATLLNNISPLWVALIALFVWRERLRGRFWLGLALTLLGAVVVLGNDLILHPHLSNGDLMAVVSSLFYAGYFMVTQKGRQTVDAVTHTWIMTLVASLVLFGITRAFAMPLTGYPPLTYLSFLGAALLCQVGGMFSVTYALGKLPASIVSPTMIAQPVLTALLAIPLFGEPLMPGQWIGGLLTLSGIYLLNTHSETSHAPTVESVPIPPGVN